MNESDKAEAQFKNLTAILLFLVSFVVILAATYNLARAYRMNDTKTAIPEYVFTYAENQSYDYPTSEGARKFAELVDKRTNGRIKIQVFAEAELGDESSVLEQMQFGGIDFARVSLSPLAEVVPKIDILQMPFLYENQTHMWKVLEGEIGERVLRSFDTALLEPLSWYDGGCRSFYTTKPIYRLEDMKGMKIRIQQSRVMADLMNLLGIQAVPTVWADVYSAIQQGKIDGAENSLPAYESQHHYEVAPYYIADEHTRVPELQLASKATWKKLSAEDQELIRECARESASYERVLWKSREKSAEMAAKKAGCEIIRLAPEEQKKFQQAVVPIYEKYCSGYMDILEEIIAMKRNQ